MLTRKVAKFAFLVMVVASILFVGVGDAYAQKPPPKKKLQAVTNADRLAAAKRDIKKGVLPGAAGKYVKTTGKSSKTPTGTSALTPAGATAAALTPGAVPDYFGLTPNYANSPMPRGAIATLSLNAGGSNYSQYPTVTIADVYGTGYGATMTVTVSSGVIIAATLLNAGTNYTAPMVVIQDPSGTDADISAAIGGPLTGGIRKFVDGLPGLTAVGANNLGQYIPLGVP